MKTAHWQVRGDKLPFLPLGNIGYTPSWKICPCFCVEFGNEDCSKKTVLNYRQNWIDAKCQCFNPQQKLPQWSLDEQKKYSDTFQVVGSLANIGVSKEI